MLIILNICFVEGELAKAIRSTTPDLRFGLYHSLYEWYHPLYRRDKHNNFTTNDFVAHKMLPEMYELVSFIIFSLVI